MRQISFVARIFVAAGVVQGLTLWPAFLWAQAPALDRAAWIGVKVMPKLNAEIKGEHGFTEEKNWSLPWVVQDVKGDSIYVGDHEKGWIPYGRVARPVKGVAIGAREAIAIARTRLVSPWPSLFFDSRHAFG